MTEAIDHAQHNANWQKVFKPRYAQRGLLILTVAFGILSLIPPFRMIGSLVLRAVTLTSILTASADKENPRDWKSCAMHTVKLGITTLGIVTLVTGNPLFLIAALITDIALQTMGTIKTIPKLVASKSSEFMFGSLANIGANLSIAVVDSCVLAALFTGSWELMLVGVIVSIVMMAMLLCVLGIKRRFKPNAGLFIDMFAYCTLLGLMVASACVISKVERTDRNSEYAYTNKSDHDVEVHGRKGEVDIIKPGETYHRVYTDIAFPHDKISVISLGPDASKTLVTPEVNDVNVLIHDSWPKELFPMAPIGGPALYTQHMEPDC